MVEETYFDDQKVESPQSEFDASDIASATLGEILGMGTANPIDGFGGGLEEDGNGKLQVNPAYFDGTIDGLTNPLTADLDADGYNVQNVAALEADERSITDMGGRVGLSTDQSLPNDTITQLFIDSIFDDRFGNAISLDTTNNVISIDQSGLYLVSFVASVTGLTSGEETRYIVRVDGSANEGTIQFPNSTGSFEEGIGPYPLALNLTSGQQLSFSVYQNTGNSQTIRSPKRKTFVNVVKLG